MFTSLVSLFSQPTIQAVATGLLTGVVAGTALVGAGLVPLGEPPTTPTTALLACPGGGPVLARVPSGQALLVTARSEDGAWLEVYIAELGAERAWAPTAALTLQASVDGLPIGDCESPFVTLPPTPTPAPSVAPSQAVIASVAPATASPGPSPSATPSPKPTSTPRPTATPKPTPTVTPLPPPPTIPPTPAPTAFVDHTAPVVTNITTTGYYDAGNNQYFIYRPSTNTSICGAVPFSAMVSATITDVDDTVTEAILYYQPSGGAIYSFSMANTSGNTWQRSIAAQDSWADGQIVYWIRALDNHGNLSSGYYPSTPYILGLGTCFA